MATIKVVSKKAKVEKALDKAVKTKKFVPKQAEKVEKKKSESVYIKLDKKDALAETAKSVLFSINDIAVWINKKGLFPSEYTNTITCSILLDFDYNYIDLETALNSEDSENYETMKGQDLIEYIQGE